MPSAGETTPTADDGVLHGTDDLRLLLARAYYHSAQLGRAEVTLTRITAESPTDAYAHLLLGRTLQRAGRHAEAARPLALAEILGDYERPRGLRRHVPVGQPPDSVTRPSLEGGDGPARVTAAATRGGAGTTTGQEPPGSCSRRLCGS